MQKKQLKYCPVCGSENIENKDTIKCFDCDFIYFHGVRSATAVILEYKDKIVFTRRKLDPHKGMLGLPGGFMDKDETAEQGLQRECQEEIGINIDMNNLRYLGAYPNDYFYGGVDYKTCDLFFVAKIDEFEPQIDEEEIKEVMLLAKDEIDLEKLAFVSQKKAIKKYLDNSYNF